MKILFISDIHSNILSLNALLEKESFDKIYCCGDLVGYYTNPNEVVEMCIKNNIKCIKGNHDVAAYDLYEAINFNKNALDSIIWTVKNLSEENSNFLENLPYVLKENNFTIVHGTASNPKEFNYYTQFSIKRDLEKIDTRFLISGHSHIPMLCKLINSNNKGYSKLKIEEIEYDKDYYLDKDSKYYINCGSLGQSRNGFAGGIYLSYDTDKDTFRFNQLEYDMDRIKEDIIKNKLPIINYERLLIGR